MASETPILGGRPPWVDGRAVTVVGASEEDLLAGSPVAIGLNAAGQLGALRVRADAGGTVDPGEKSWSGAMAEWWAAEEISLTRWDGAEALTPPVVLVGTSALLDAHAAVAEARAVDPDGVAAITALGAEAARGVDPADARRRLVELAARGAVTHAEPVLRFGAAGRGFVELIENVNHRAGPDGQSLVGDSLRAALFGRFGAVPVNLGARERPPALDLTTMLVFCVPLAEL